MISIFSRPFFHGEKGGILTILLHPFYEDRRELPSGFEVRFASLRSGGRRLAVRKMIECHISARPRTPFCHYVAFPLKGKREI